jgi:hypothetical protein
MSESTNPETGESSGMKDGDSDSGLSLFPPTPLTSLRSVITAHSHAIGHIRNPV